MNTLVNLPRSLRVAVSLFVLLATGAVLKIAQPILMPLALATLMAFVLNPMVKRIRRLGLPQPVAVLLVTCLASVAWLGVFSVVSVQIKQLADDIPSRRANLERRVLTVKRWFQGGTLDRLRRTFDGIDESTDEVIAHETEQSQRMTEKRRRNSVSDSHTLSGRLEAWWRELSDKTEPPGPAVATTAERVAEPNIDSQAGSGDKAEETPAQAGEPYWWQLSPWYFSVLDGIGMLGLVVLLTIFFLWQQGDLRDRIVTISGRGSLATTTKALGDAGSRISRFLFMQFIINATYGVAVMIGLLVIGVEYAPLWGLVAALFRYVPYVGPWIAALLPIGLSFVMYDGWLTPALVIGLFVVLELLSNNVMEPILYGRGVGLSEVAVILAAVFWGWMWGPIGLMLATPMTVCLVVLGRYVPGLRMFDQLLGESPEVGAAMRLYQRLLAHADEDAEELVEAHLKEHSIAETCDTLILPALQYAHQDYAAGQLDDDDLRWIETTMHGIVEEIRDWRVEREQQAGQPDPTAGDADDQPKCKPKGEQERDSRPRIVGIASRTDVEELAVAAVFKGLPTDRCRCNVISSDLLTSERIARIIEEQPLAVCISTFPPGDVAATRQLCKRLREKLPDAKIYIGRWSGANNVHRNEQFMQAGANKVVESAVELDRLLRSAVQLCELSPWNGETRPQDGTTSRTESAA